MSSSKNFSIFKEQIARKPNHYPWTQDYINAMWESFWTPNEFNFQSDIHNFKTDLSIQEKEIITKTLSAIGQLEISVKKFWSKLGDNLPHPSLTDLGLVMAHVEVIHNGAYEKLLEVLDLSEKFEENLKVDIILGRVKYLRKHLDKQYDDNKKQYIFSLILFTLFIEGTSLFSQFYIINWFNRYRNVLKDTGQQVLYTMKEETLHQQIGIKLINTIHREHPELFDKELEDKIIYEVGEAFKWESKIIDWILGDFKGERISKDILKEYIKDRINQSLIQIGFKAPYAIDAEKERDFEWMNEDSLGNNMTDFFHRKPTEYSKKNRGLKGDDLF